MKKPPRRKDLTGKEFHHWTVIRFDHLIGNVVFWLCRCRCGTEKAIRAFSLTSKHPQSQSRSCGCYKEERLKTDGGRHVIHNLCKSPIYTKWKLMRQRCRDPNQDRYKDYGGRGIQICDRWNNFQNFYDDMFPTWYKGASLDRKDVNGHYTPENCRWVSKLEQAQNKTNTLYVMFNGEKRRLKELCDQELLPNNYSCIKSRLQMGWKEQTAIWKSTEDNMSVGEKQIKEWLSIKHVSYVYRKTFNDCKDKTYLVFDFFLPDHNMLIEFDGPHHRKAFNFGKRKQTPEEMLARTQLHDKMKEDYALQKGYKMIRISKSKTIQEILDKEIQ